MLEDDEKRIAWVKHLNAAIANEETAQIRLAEAVRGLEVLNEREHKLIAEYDALRAAGLGDSPEERVQAMDKLNKLILEIKNLGPMKHRQGSELGTARTELKGFED